MSNYHWLTGEEMVPPSERDYAPAADKDSMKDKNIKTNGEPINWSLRQKCEKMNSEELESMVREANRVLTERKNERANMLIKTVCVALNELKGMGNVSFSFDCDECYIHDILDEVDFFDKNMFKIR